MKPILFFVAALLLNLSASYGQEAAAINAALDKMTSASITGDIPQMLQSTSPRLIKVMGGREQPSLFFREAYAKLAKQNVKIDSAAHYPAREILTFAGIQYCFIPQILIMRIPDTSKRMLTLTALMALKEKGGTDWTFLDCSQLNEEKVALLLPEFNGHEYPTVPDMKPSVLPKEEVDQAIDLFFKGLDRHFQQTSDKP